MKINKSTNGFTIIELLIAMSIALLLSVLLSKILISTTRIASDSSQQSYSQKSARSALGFLSKEIMDAEEIELPNQDAQASDSLFIKGLKKKDKKMIPDVTNKIYKPENDLSVPWVEGKPVIVYVNGVNQKTGFTLDYVNKTITFASANQASDVVTADFSYALDVEYNLSGGNLVKLSGKDSNINSQIDESEVIKNQIISNNLINFSQSPRVYTFTWISTNNYKIELVYTNYNISTVINVSSGVMVKNVSATLPSDEVLSASTQLRSLYFTSADNGWIVGQNGTIFQHSSTGWTNRTGNNQNSLNSVYFINQDNGWAVGENNTILKYVNGAWSEEVGDGNLNDLYPKDNNSIYAVGAKGTGASVSNYSGNTPWVNTAYSSYKVFNSISEYNSIRYAAANDGMVYYQETSPFGDGSDGDATINGTVNIKNLYEGDNVAGVITHRGVDKGLLKGVGSYNSGSGAVPNFNNITINSGGILTTSQGIKLELKAKNNFTIDLGGLVIANGVEYHGGNGGYRADSGNPITLSIKSIVLSGSIASNGHDGCCGNGTDAGHGGAIDIITPNLVVNNGVISSIGGNGGSANYNRESSAGNGGNGGVVTVKSTGYSGSQPILNGGSGGNGEAPYPAGSPGLLGTFNNQPYSLILGWFPFFSTSFTSYDFLDSAIVPDDSNPANYNLWMVGEAGVIYKYPSTTKIWESSANTQNKTPTKDNLNAVNFFDSKSAWAVGNAGTVLKYDADLNQWFSIPSGTPNNLNEVFMYSKDEGYIVGDNKTLLKISNIKGEN